MKRSRKTLKTLQIAVDKENLAGREPIADMKDVISNKKLETVKKKGAVNVNEKRTINKTSTTTLNLNKKNQEKTNANNTKKIETLITDLTSDGPPSDTYWQNIAESRRVALESTLKENVDLHNKLTELEYENKSLKEMLDEAKSLVEVLTEMLNEQESSINSRDNIPENDADDSTEEEVDVSFKSCV